MYSNKQNGLEQAESDTPLVPHGKKPWFTASYGIRQVTAVVTAGYSRLQLVIAGYSRLRQVTAGYSRIQHVTAGYGIS